MFKKKISAFETCSQFTRHYGLDKNRRFQLAVSGRCAFPRENLGQTIKFYYRSSCWEHRWTEVLTHRGRDFRMYLHFSSTTRLGASCSESISTIGRNSESGVSRRSGKFNKVAGILSWIHVTISRKTVVFASHVLHHARYASRTTRSDSVLFR